jgi:glycosyltransferase involved in cell wall biosynthesis
MVRLSPTDDFVLLGDEEAAALIDLQGPNVRVVPVELRVPPSRAAAAGGRRSISDMLRLSRAVAREELDVFFSPSVYAYYPLPPRLAAVVCIHDAIASRYPELTFPTRRDRLYWDLKVWLAIRQSRLVLTVSEYAAGELATVMGIRPDRIRVSGEAPADSFRPIEQPHVIRAAAERAGLPPDARWFMYVGGFNPHKNVDLLVRAHAKLARTCDSSPPYLLLVGPLKNDRFYADPARIREAIAAAGTEDLVIWLGFVADEELRYLNSGALAVVLPSESEGFGLPAVEAAACGTPTVATTESPLPDLLAGGGLFVKPGDVDALESALARMLRDDARHEMGRVARERAEQLSWERSARLTLDALYEAAA